MKRIYFLRHAKAEESAKEGDFYRKLSKKGKKDIQLMLERLKSFEFNLNCIISSPATRTSQTAREFAQTLGCELVFEECLYEAEAKDIINLIKTIDENYQEIMLVGHNPALKESIELLSEIHLPSFATCSVLCLELPSFKELKLHQARLVFFENSKNLKERHL
ncbi:phosphoglycerate mutase [Campylobacter sp. MIT 12-5580]|uniref:SixA phosphatase family protein n=1 Tax=Campylobacter sp. MIT 12-5580 TaxID=2040651 RepID=UPI0010F7365F|nr:histidine phosphatase family protein [Campylobacter sp. MIT 12-5580]TKX29050.1 phosphoglycerate mutase [Campylobacter sp. MIT 12-5580]